MQPARVHGFVVVSTGGGYLAAVVQPDADVEGALVELDDAAYIIADAWEDLDVYARVVTAAQTLKGDVRPCCMYVRSDAAGPEVCDGRLADRSRADVIADIRCFLGIGEP